MLDPDVILAQSKKPLATDGQGTGSLTAVLHPSSTGNRSLAHAVLQPCLYVLCVQAKACDGAQSRESSTRLEVPLTYL